MAGVPRRPWCELVSLRPQFRRCLALTFEAALDSVAGAAAVGIKCRAIHALETGMDQSDIQDVQKPDSRAIRRHARLPAQSRP